MRSLCDTLGSSASRWGKVQVVDHGGRGRLGEPELDGLVLDTLLRVRLRVRVTRFKLSP